MKMQKMDPKQVPQLVVLSALVLGVLGYAGFTYFGEATPAAATTDGDKREVAAQVPEPDPAAATPLGNVPTTLPAGIGSAGFNPDPFKPAAGALEVKPAPMPVLAPKVKVETTEQKPKETPAAKKATEEPKKDQEQEKPAPPPEPVRPELMVTGIISAEDGDNMALVSVGTDRMVVRVGDVLVASQQEFNVKKIAMDGIIISPVTLPAKPASSKPKDAPKAASKSDKKQVKDKGPVRWTFPVGKPMEPKVEAKANSAAPESKAAVSTASLQN